MPAPICCSNRPLLGCIYSPCYLLVVVQKIYGQHFHWTSNRNRLQVSLNSILGLLLPGTLLTRVNIGPDVLSVSWPPAKSPRPCLLSCRRQSVHFGRADYVTPCESSILGPPFVDCHHLLELGLVVDTGTKYHFLL